jgi:hypothetical protein
MIVLASIATLPAAGADLAKPSLCHYCFRRNAAR